MLRYLAVITMIRYIDCCMQTYVSRLQCLGLLIQAQISSIGIQSQRSRHSYLGYCIQLGYLGQDILPGYLCCSNEGWISYLDIQIIQVSWLWSKCLGSQIQVSRLGYHGLVIQTQVYSLIRYQGIGIQYVLFCPCQVSRLQYLGLGNQVFI